jgi:hypothetical protein
VSLPISGWHQPARRRSRSARESRLALARNLASRKLVFDFGRYAKRQPGVLMPEAAMDEHDRLVFRVNDVGSARRIRDVQLVWEPLPMEKTATVRSGRVLRARIPLITLLRVARSTMSAIQLGCAKLVHELGDRSELIADCALPVSLVKIRAGRNGRRALPRMARSGR